MLGVDYFLQKFPDLGNICSFVFFFFLQDKESKMRGENFRENQDNPRATGEVLDR